MNPTRCCRPHGYPSSRPIGRANPRSFIKRHTLRMVNFHDPAVLLQDQCVYYAFSASLRKLKNPPGLIFSVALLKLSVTVDGLYMWVHILQLRVTLFPLTSGRPLHIRWEFVTTLYYEWHVIRGHRPYRWTIWVCSYMSSPASE